MCIYFCTAIECPELGDPTNGRKIGDQHTFQNVVQFTCNRGYVLIGSKSLFCQASGKWNGTVAECMRKSKVEEPYFWLRSLGSIDYVFVYALHNQRVNPREPPVSYSKVFSMSSQGKGRGATSLTLSCK